jgi:ribulose-phosphate 3-epimerase
MSFTSPIVPAIIPQSYDDLVAQVGKITGLPEVHVDVVDGVFVPSISWPYIGGDDVVRAFDLLAVFSLEVDLMVAKPLPAAEAWLKAGADQLVFHIETISVEAFKAFTDECKVSVGVSLNSATPLSQLHPYLPYADYIQCMGIASIGSQGQPFDESVIARLTQLQNEYPNLPLSIDGSVNQNTIPLLAPLKLPRLIVGSAIMGAADAKEAYHTLTTLAVA